MLYKKINLEFKDSLSEEEKEKIISGENMTIDDIELMCEERGLENIRNKKIKEKNIENGTENYEEENKKEDILHIFI